MINTYNLKKKNLSEVDETPDNLNIKLLILNRNTL